MMNLSEEYIGIHLCNFALASGLLGMIRMYKQKRKIDTLTIIKVKNFALTILVSRK